MPAACVTSLPTLDKLRKYVHETLCKHDALEPVHSPLHQALVTRSGRVCGLFFQVSGPRSVKVYAMWAGEENRILFYDSTGLRYAETRLSDGPDPASVVQEESRRRAA